MISTDRGKPAFTFIGLLALTPACGPTPSDKVVLDSHREILDAREQFDSSLSNSTSALGRDEARAEYQGKLLDAIQKVADETTGPQQEAAVILQQLTEQMAIENEKFSTASASVLVQRILDPAVMTTPQEYLFQRETLTHYVNESNALDDSARKFFDDTETELTSLPENEYTTGILEGLQRSRSSQLPALESSCEAHQRYGERMLAIVELLESRHGDWRIVVDEIRFPLNDDLERFTELTNSQAAAETELNRVHPADACAGGFPGMTPVSNEIGARVGMLVDNASRKKRSRALQRCHSTRDLSVASVFLQKRCAHGADGPRRMSADFGSPRTIFHQIMGHWRHALKNLDPRVCARFRRMNPFFATEF